MLRRFNPTSARGVCEILAISLLSMIKALISFLWLFFAKTMMDLEYHFFHDMRLKDVVLKIPYFCDDAQLR